MSEFVAAPGSRRPAWDGGGDETTPARHSQRGALAAERAAAPAEAVVLRPDGRLPGADPAGLEPGPVVVDDGSRGHVARLCCAPTDRRGHRQLGRGPLTTRVAVAICWGTDRDVRPPAPGRVPENGLYRDLRHTTRPSARTHSSTVGGTGHQRAGRRGGRCDRTNRGRWSLSEIGKRSRRPRRRDACGQALIRAEVGSYIGRSDTSTGCRTPAMSTSQAPASTHAGVTGSPPPETMARPTAPPSVQPYDAART